MHLLVNFSKVTYTGMYWYTTKRIRRASGYSIFKDDVTHGFILYNIYIAILWLID